MRVFLVVMVIAVLVGVGPGRGWSQVAGPPPAPTTTTPIVAPAATSDAAAPADDVAGQPPAPPAPAPPDDNVQSQDELPTVGKLPSSLDECQPIEQPETPVTSNAPPVQWTKWELSGKLVDSPAFARALFDAYLRTHRAITASVRADLAELARTAGYHVIGLGTRELANGDVLASLVIVPLPLIRRVDVAIKQSFFEPLLDQDVRRRMQLRVGTHISWSPMLRKCETLREQQRIEEYLRDEGFFDARATVRINVEESGGAFVDVVVRLGPGYQLGKIRIERVGAATVNEAEIRVNFAHQGTCVVLNICFGKARFTRNQHQLDINNVVELFHRRGFPAVRVQSDFEPATSFDRARKVVNFTLRIDQRRQLDVAFEGHDPDRIQEAKLREQITFNQAGSADDIEANVSSNKLTQYMQSRGYFDARVTWFRKPEPLLDRITFRIETGEPRRVNQLAFVGNQELSDATLLDAIGTREYSQFRSVFGDNPAATASQLVNDAERIRTAYRKAGFRAAAVSPIASPNARGLRNAAQSVAELALNNGEGQLAVAFRITEGPETTLDQLEFQIDTGRGFSTDIANPEARSLCDIAVAVTADALRASLASVTVPTWRVERTAPNRCVVDLSDTRFQEDVVATIPTQLLDRLQQQGRRNAKLDYEATEQSPNHMVAVIKLSSLPRQRFGKVFLRGNYRTRASVILGELGFTEGALLSSDQVATGAARLRATGLFEAVKIDFLDNAESGDRNINAIVRVEERFEKRFRIDGEGGYSFLNGGLFLKATGVVGNIAGVGISSQLIGQLRFTCVDLDARCAAIAQAEVNTKLPRWVVRRYVPLEFDADVTAFYRSLPTPRFGQLQTLGATVSGSRSNLRTRTDSHSARSITYGLRYDFRRRDRQENALRPAGAGSDSAQLPVTTVTGAIVARVEWEQRVDRRGVLAPLGPEDGFRFEASATFASPYLLGQATFVKGSAAVQKFQSVGKNLILRTDLRYDHGIPLGGAALLPDVERFFSGGDTTVRGYAEDSLATETILSSVPPFGNLEQLHVRPAGGNIRGLASFDAQLRIFSAFASAVFIDSGVVTNRWRDVNREKIRFGVGMAFARVVTGFGALTLEYAVPIAPQLGDDPRGRWHLGFAMRF